MDSQLKTQMEQAQALIRDLAETASDWQGQGKAWQGQGKAWLVVVAQLRKGAPDFFSSPGTGLDCAVREIERLQACERHMKVLQEELSLAKGKAAPASADHSAATAEASAANESAAVAGVKLAQLWNALAANTQEQALSRVQALNRFFNLYTDLRSSMTEVEHAFRSADMVKGSEGCVMTTNKELMRSEYQKWWDDFEAAHPDWHFADADTMRWNVWQAALSQRSEAVPSAAAGGQVENDFRKEADRLYNRLMSDDPDHNDCTDAANFIRKILGDVIGPDGYATWKDAAIAERLRRVKAESDLAAQPTPAQGDSVLVNTQVYVPRPVRIQLDESQKTSTWLENRKKTEACDGGDWVRFWKCESHTYETRRLNEDDCKLIEATIDATLAAIAQPATSHSSADAVEAALAIAREALTDIAAFDDSGANSHLKFHGSYALFDEPSAARAARVALLRMDAAEAELQVLSIPTVNLKETSK